MENGVMFQYFEWNLPNEGNLWKRLKDDAARLKEIGVTAVWIPPAYKGQNSDDVGYGVYDLYDLGEFDQKGTVRTKYGTKKELIDMIDVMHSHQISVYLDVVMNHKAAADYTEKFLVKEVDPNDRNKFISDAYEIEGWTGFDFPGRKEQYSDFKWHWHHFSGVDYDQSTGKKAIFQIQGENKSWSDSVDDENGNFDYLMFADIDYNHPDVIEEMKKWGIWVSKELKLDGMRLDAIKHINENFIHDFLGAVRAELGENFYAVGEYWKRNKDSLDNYLNEVQHRINLFDVPLHFNMYQASVKGRDYDLQNLVKGSLVINQPDLAVTFVENHDTQHGSSLESSIKDWFKPLAYGIILLMQKGYPCIFYGDYYGVGGKESPHRLILDILIDARKKYAYGDQKIYFDHPNTAGFVRMGENVHPGSGLALLISNGEDGDKVMYVGDTRKGQIWHEITGSIDEEITIDEQGNGKFLVKGGKLSVWVERQVNKL